MKRKTLLTLVVSLCVVIVSMLPFVAACGEKPTPTPPGPTVETGPPIILGAPLSIGYPDGICAKDNLQLAVDEINQNGGVNVGGVMHPFKLEVIDTRDLEPGVPTSETLLAVEKLILDKKANFIVGGPIRSEAALATMDLVSKYATVTVWSAGFLSPAMDAKVAEDYQKYKYCFRSQGNAIPIIGESTTIIESIKGAEGFDKAFIMVQDVAHARGAGDKVNSVLPDKGFTVVGYEKYPSGSTDFSVGLLKAKDAGAQVLYVWFDMPEASILMKQAYDMQLPALIVGFIVAAQDSEAWKALDGKCAYVINNFPKAGVAPSNAIPLAAKYIALHTSKFGKPPGLTWVAPTSYQVVYILKDAIERAGSYENPDSVIAALETTDMDGVYGKIKFNPENHQIVYSMNPAEGAVTTWVQWVDGKQIAVYPPDVATDPVALPPWMK